jgi:hypothetical protein
MEAQSRSKKVSEEVTSFFRAMGSLITAKTVILNVLRRGTREAAGGEVNRSK